MTTTELRLLSPRDFHTIHMDIRQQYEAVLQVACNINNNPMAERIRMFFDEKYPLYKLPNATNDCVCPRMIAIYLLSKHTNLQDKDMVLFLGLTVNSKQCVRYRKCVETDLFIKWTPTMKIIKEFEKTPSV